MNNKGFMMLDREILEDPLYFSERFTHIQAFEDLCFLAAYKDRTFSIRGNKVTLKRGQVAKSVRDLSTRWQWSVNTVTKFLKELQTDGYIDTQKTPVNQIITIKKYLLFNTQTNTQTETQTETFLINKLEERIKQLEREKEELTKVSKKKEEDFSELTQTFEKFRLRYKQYGGKVRGLETELENLKKKHKDWKEIIPLLLDAIEKENSARQQAKAMGKFFPEMKNLQTYINQRAWETYIDDSTNASDDNEYKPIADGVYQRWNPTRQCLEINTPYLSMLNDGYTDDNRPDGATVAWQMYSWVWDSSKKEWVKQE